MNRDVQGEMGRTDNSGDDQTIKDSPCHPIAGRAGWRLGKRRAERWEVGDLCAMCVCAC